MIIIDDDLKVLYNSKEQMRYTWDDIASILNEKYNTHYSADTFRKRCAKFKDNIDYPEVTESNDELNIEEEFLIRKEIQRYKDERTQLNQLYRQASREDMLKDIAVECAEKIAEKYPFEKNLFTAADFDLSSNCGILLLSDWHYGIEIDNHWNKYNSTICQRRLDTLFKEVVNFTETYKFNKLYIINLGDLISGRIHSQIRIENREDVISQVMNVSELLARFLNNLSRHVKLEYYDCLDNHSRIEPNKKESLRLESLARIITWYLIERFKNDTSITIHFNQYSDDIVSFETSDGWNIVGVHGDLDSQRAVIKNMRGMLIERPDLICTAHMHHFSSNEENECMWVSNPSLMGTDGYAQSKRLTSKPAQTLIVTNKKSPTYAIHRITLS